MANLDPRRMDDPLQIPRSVFARVLKGVGVAAKISDNEIEALFEWASSRPEAALTAGEWRTEVEKALLGSANRLRSLGHLAVAVASLRESSRSGNSVSSGHLKYLWRIIHQTLTSSASRQSRRTLNDAGTSVFKTSPSRSAQGFLSLPLCSLVTDGRIDELIRLHVWLPDGQRGNHGFAIHSHQPFAQSWALAGRLKDFRYIIDRNEESGRSTHAEYSIGWNDGKDLKATTSTYKTHQAYSTVVNTGKLARATEESPTFYSRDMTNTIPAGAFHRTEASTDALHATLFYFDSSRGFQMDASILGPKQDDSFTQYRDPGGITATDLAQMVQTVRIWEEMMEEGRLHAKKAQWEPALKAFDSAHSLLEAAHFPKPATHYRSLVLGELGSTYRRFGRYTRAREILEPLLAEMSTTPTGVELAGELGVVYRHMGLLEEARAALQKQYDAALTLGLDTAACRALGNLGMVNYQLSQLDPRGNGALLDAAIEQLKTRVNLARRLRDAPPADPKIRDKWLWDALRWESIGLDRLSLCYTARGDTRAAVEAAEQSQRLPGKSKDPTIWAMSAFFYGRALWYSGRREEALAQFNPDPGAKMACTPAIALCKESSEEHRGYLRELIEAGADMDRVDETGYSALDYGVFGGDDATIQVVCDGLYRTMSGKVEDVETQVKQRLEEAQLRKDYRELFQEKLRDVLLHGGCDRRKVLTMLRQTYAYALASDEDKRQKFDQLRCVRYMDLKSFGRLPRSSDGLAQILAPMKVDDEAYEVHGDERTADFVIFMSYRWIGKDSGTAAPDDGNHTQYLRMIRAVEEFLVLHPEVSRDELSIWVVSSENSSSIHSQLRRSHIDLLARITHALTRRTRDPELQHCLCFWPNATLLSAFTTTYTTVARGALSKC